MSYEPKNKDAAFKMGKAKAALVLEQPFFASLILSMRLIEDETLSPPTLATDGKTVWYHPGFIEKQNLAQTKWALCHEVGHAVFAHMFRRGSREPRRWNVAGDYIINQLLEDENIGERIEGTYFNPQLVQQGNGTTDGVYELIPEESGGGGGQGGQGGQGGGGWDECRDSGGSAAEQAADAAEMQVRVAQAAQAAKMCGKTSARIDAFVDAVLKPKIDWRDVLRRFISVRAKVEHTYAKPKRRWIAEDLFLPSLGGQAMGEILIAVDQSGSVSEQEVAEFKAEIVAIHGDVRPTKTHVFYFDSQVAKTETYEQDDTPDIRRYTCGGTAFSPIFAKAEELDLEPVCCVVLTDLCCSDFGPAPNYPVLWITTHATVAPWGTVVEMNPKGL